VPDARIASIPNGIDLSIRPMGRVRGPARRLLCLGRLRKFDFATLLSAFDTVAGEHPDVELRIAGRGDADDIESLLANLPRARTRTTVVGFSPSAEEMEWADAIVHPSRAEGMSNALLEAMCVGLPCVASDIAPNREVLGDTALFFALDDPETLRIQMRRLMLEPALGASLAAAARQRVTERFSIDRVATRYGALYDELLQGRPQVRRKTA
jgi:glycosyltransferase involved in cell wall biosynthesis